MDSTAVDRFAAFLERLHTLRPVRWAVAYAAISWLSLQAVVLLVDVYQAGPEVKRSAVAVLAAGFPAVLFLAWALDSRSRARGAVVVAGVLLSVLIGVLIHQRLDRRVTAGQSTLLVLSPTDLRAATGDQLGPRIHESLLDSLSRERALKALSRSVAGSFAAEKEAPADFARSQGATHFVEISIKDATAVADDPRLEVTAQLIAVADGTHVASYTKGYRAVSTVGIERDLATLLTGAFRIMLGPEDWASLGEVRTDSEPARTLFKQAEVNIRYGLGEGWDQIYAEALVLDPKFAQAAARRSLMTQGYADANTRANERRALKEKFDHDPDFLFFSFGPFGVYSNVGEEWETRFSADPLFLLRQAHDQEVVETAWATPPKDRTTGKPVMPKTLAAYERAITADPGLWWPRAHLANLRYRLGDFGGADEELVALERSFPFTGDDWELLRIQARLAATGDLAELRDRVEAYVAATRPPPTPGRRGNVHVLETEHALAQLSGDLRHAIALGHVLGGDPLVGLTAEWGPLLQRNFNGDDEAAVDDFILGDLAAAREHAAARVREIDAKRGADGVVPGKNLPMRVQYDREFWRFIADPKAFGADDLKALEARLRYRGWVQANPMQIAFMYAWSGDRERATYWLDACLTTVYWCNAKLMARDPWWTPLYDHPPFEQLLLAHGATLVKHPRPARQTRR